MSQPRSELSSLLSRLPKVDQVLDQPALADSGWQRAIQKRLVTDALDALRAEVRDGKTPALPDAAALASRVRATLDDWSRPRPRPVINATGVLLHTNLGRAPLSPAARRAMVDAAGSCDLEVVLPTGQRGSRFTALLPLLRAVLHAEDAHVVNNNAAALLLACTVLGPPGGVVLSHGQMVEIGDGFRVATMAAAGGCPVIGVGSTNRTHPRDYEAALRGEAPGHEGRPASAILWAHRSNFEQSGFVREVELPALSEIARAHGVPLVADLGSGSLGGGLPEGEPTVMEYLQQGADLVLCSGDKLMGGPQAGIIAGKAELVQRCRRHPMARALRPDKTTLAALHATFAAHARPQGVPSLPLHQMATVSVTELRQRAEALASALAWPLPQAVVDSRATIGGGSLPGDTMDSVALRVPTKAPSRDAKRLRLGDPPVVGRIEDDALLLDLRSVDPHDDERLLHALRALQSR
ncbi:L-seryl-tRNA(Sec) selenium transferase [Paraliomyxa miuraensis]|uniref:L-seryl-tRNA(Sec) selenium transferase n=1 Tax=Paraliomyxa miuraensis TaxID=376150 RepID=UPI002259D403|nr:L-seryl-tRNA(Sec) selenium transferase [Paraliomyxa miuraensis]MCX4241891.1 L-seryl-tRNA(Sec) selenium transferase [Paraliomyxa miuraensis]